MTHFKESLVSAALLFGAAAMPAIAGSSTSSAASDSSATSSGSVSGSFEKSSGASSKATPVAAGDYRLIEVAAAPGRPGQVRMTLQALADSSADGEFYLYLPQAAFERSQVAPGQVVAALARPYGLEFANGASRQAFFLVLADDWHRELRTNAVEL